MKTICFIRHAKSEQNTNCADIDRTLNARGEKDAPLMLERLKRYGIKPDIVISSTAKRALSTAKVFADGFYGVEFTLNERLYLTPICAYLDVIRAIEDKYKCVFIVGHNPTITNICENLSGELIGNIPTCGIFCMTFDVGRFEDISANSGQKLFFDFPKRVES
jgi:phosphohistidine phosphatase